MDDRISVWLDDHCTDGEIPSRLTPPGWIGVKTPQEVIELLKTNTVERMSLDNDLGLLALEEGELTEGYQVMDWLERAWIEGVVKECPRLYFHTDNASAKMRMKMVGRRIMELERDRDLEQTRRASEEPQ